MSTDVSSKEEDIEEARGLGNSCNESQTLQRLSSHGGFISYRPFREGDRDQLQELHKEWFPVTYKDEFYDELVYERMVNTGEKLFTCAIVYHDDDRMQQYSTSAQCATESPNTPTEASNSQLSDVEEDYIIACVVGSMLDVIRLDKETGSLLVSDRFRHTQVFYIMTLGTVSDFRNARLATSLVEKCINIAEKNEQCGAIYLHVITFNTTAIRFYERLGFYRVKEIESKSRVLESIS